MLFSIFIIIQGGSTNFCPFKKIKIIDMTFELIGPFNQTKIIYSKNM